MPAQIGSLFASLTLDLRPWGQQWARAESVSTRALHTVERRAGLTSRAVGNFQKQISNRRVQPYSLIAATRAFEGANERVGLLRGSLIAATTAIGGFAAALSTSVILRYADSFTLLNNQLRVTARGAGDLEARLSALSDISHRSRSGLQDTTVLFSRLAKAQPNRDPEQLLRNVETIQKALQLGGASVQEASSAAIQFSQAIASNRLGGEELRAILETPLGLELARGMDVTIGKFRELAHAGELTADILLASLDKASSRIDKQFANSVRTFDQAVKQADNRLTEYTGRLDKSIGATRRMGDGVLFLADNLDTLVPFLASVGAAFTTLFAGRAAGRFANFIDRNTIGAFRQFGAEAKQGFQEASDNANAFRADLKKVNREIGALALRRSTGGVEEFADKGVIKKLEREQENLKKLDNERLALIERQARKQEEVAGITAKSSSRMVSATQKVADSEARLNSLLADEERLRRDLARATTREQANVTAGRPVFSQRVINDAAKERKSLEKEIGRIQSRVATETERLAKRRLAVTTQVTKAEQAAAKARIAAQAEVARIQQQVKDVDQRRVVQVGVVRGLQGEAQDTGTTAAAEQSRQLAAEAARLRSGLGAATKQMTAMQAASRATAVAWTATRAAGSSLVAFLGGPWGVAFVAAIGIMTAFGIQSVKTAERARKVKEDLDRIFEERTETGQPEARDTLAFRRIKTQLDGLKESATRFKEEMEVANSSLDRALATAITPNQTGDPRAQRFGPVKQARDVIDAFVGGAGTTEEFRKEFDKLAESFGLPQDKIDSIADAAVELRQLSIAIGHTAAQSAELEKRLPFANNIDGRSTRSGVTSEIFSRQETGVISEARDADALSRLPEREQKLAKARQDLLAVFKKETNEITNAVRSFVDEITLQALNFQEATQTLSGLQSKATSLFDIDFGKPITSENIISGSALSALSQANAEIAKVERGAASFRKELSSLRNVDIGSLLDSFTPSTKKAFDEAQKGINDLLDRFDSKDISASELATGLDDIRQHLQDIGKGDILAPFIESMFRAVEGASLLGAELEEARVRAARLGVAVKDAQINQSKRDNASIGRFNIGPAGQAQNVIADFERQSRIELLPDQQKAIEDKYDDIFRALQDSSAARGPAVRAVARDLAANLVAIESAKETISRLVSQEQEIFSSLGGGHLRSLGSLDMQFGQQALALGELIAFREELTGVTNALEVLEAQRDNFLAQPLTSALGSASDIEAARAALDSVKSDFDGIIAKVSSGKLNASQLYGEFERMRELLLDAGIGRTFVDNIISRMHELIRATSLAIAKKQELEKAGPKVQVSRGRTEQRFSVPSTSGGTSPITVTRAIIPTKDIAAGTQSGVQGVVDVTLQGVSATHHHGNIVGKNTEDTVSGLNDVNRSVSGLGRNIDNLSGRPINVSVTGGGQSSGGGRFDFIGGPKTGDRQPGTLGGPSSASFTIIALTQQKLVKSALQGFTSQLESQMEALSAEAQVLQTGLEFKQLSPEQRKKAELRLAEIALENAKNQDRLAKATLSVAEAMESLSSTLNLTPNAFAAATAIRNSQSLGSSVAASGNQFDPFVSMSRLMSGFSGFAGGGAVHGPGGPKSDKVPLMGSNGEFMMTAEATRKNRRLLEALNAGKDISNLATGGIIGRIPTMASGGFVSRMPTLKSDDGMPKEMAKAIDALTMAAEKSGNERPVEVNVTILSDNPQSFQNSRAVIQRDLARGVRSGLGK